MLLMYINSHMFAECVRYTSMHEYALLKSLQKTVMPSELPLHLASE